MYSSCGVSKTCSTGASLNDLAAPHDRNIVGDDADDAEIVTDEDASQAELTVGYLQKGEDLRLH